MKHKTSRRNFLCAAAAAAATPLMSRQGKALMANDIVHIGCVGVGGKGWSDMMETSQ